MLTRNTLLLCTLLICLGTTTTVRAQSSLAELQKIMQQKAAFNETDFAALERNEPVVQLVPISDKREVAVSGLVNIRASADDFLQSYRESLTRKSNSAILEIGRFGKEPSFNDLQNLTIEPQDIEDLKQCVVGECQVKLSAAMIERFRKEIDWQAPDYQVNVTKLFKQMLLDYVRDYRTRGDVALIEYNDKRDRVSLAQEQRGLAAAPSYINESLIAHDSSVSIVEDVLVWSKIKFGLKPVLAVNHITIYRRERGVGPQVLIASKQIYANHYFNASLALTAFVSVPSATEEGYLVSENRSRADGLSGPFSKIKRGVVEKKALEGLKSILEHSKASLEGSALSATTTAELSSHQSYGWGRRLFGGVRLLLWVVVVGALIVLLVLGRRRAETAPPRTGKTLKPRVLS